MPFVTVTIKGGGAVPERLATIPDQVKAAIRDTVRKSHQKGQKR